MSTWYTHTCSYNNAKTDTYVYCCTHIQLQLCQQRITHYSMSARLTCYMYIMYFCAHVICPTIYISVLESLTVILGSPFILHDHIKHLQDQHTNVHHS